MALVKLRLLILKASEFIFPEKRIFLEINSLKHNMLHN